MAMYTVFRLQSWLSLKGPSRELLNKFFLLIFFLFTHTAVSHTRNIAGEGTRIRTGEFIVVIGVSFYTQESVIGTY